MKLRGLVVVSVVVAGVAAFAGPASALGPLHRQTLRATVSGPVDLLVVRGEVGNVTVVTGAVTRIVAVEQYNLSPPRFTHSLSEGVLHVAAPCPSSGAISLGLNNCSVDLFVTVPRSAAVDAVTEVGDVVIRGVTGNQRLRSDVGDVRADLAAAPRIVVARSSVGDVQLSVPSGVYDVHAYSDLGRAEVRGITVTSDAPNSITATSDTGDVKITGK